MTNLLHSPISAARSLMLLLAFATQPLFGAPCTVDPPPRSAARQAVARECPEGGYSLMRKTHGHWRKLPLPDIADCDPMESLFIAVDNECLSATLRMYTDAPRTLFEPVKKRVTR
jgi:hypothetical protein